MHCFLSFQYFPIFSCTLGGKRKYVSLQLMIFKKIKNHRALVCTFPLLDLSIHPANPIRLWHYFEVIETYFIGESCGYATLSCLAIQTHKSKSARLLHHHQSQMYDIKQIQSWLKICQCQCPVGGVIQWTCFWKLTHAKMKEKYQSHLSFHFVADSKVKWGPPSS